jgi:hypothetical protein
VKVLNGGEFEEYKQKSPPTFEMLMGIFESIVVEPRKELMHAMNRTTADTDLYTSLVKNILVELFSVVYC